MGNPPQQIYYPREQRSHQNRLGYGENKHGNIVGADGFAEFHYGAVHKRGEQGIVIVKRDNAERLKYLRPKIAAGGAGIANKVGNPSDDESAEWDKERLPVEEERKEFIIALLRRFRVFDVAEKQISEGEEYESGAHKEGGVFHRTRFDAVKGIVLVHCPPDYGGHGEQNRRQDYTPKSVV